MLSDQGHDFKGTGFKRDQDWMVHPILMLFLLLQGCRTKHSRQDSVPKRSLHVLL